MDFSTVNLFPHSLFSQIDFEIDGINLCSNDNLYPYKAYLETLLTYGHDAKNSHLSTSHFVKDSAHHFESRLFDFSIIPHIDFLHTPRVIPANISMKLKLTRSPDSFSILSKSNSDLYIKIHSLNLFV